MTPPASNFFGALALILAAATAFGQVSIQPGLRSPGQAGGRTAMLSQPAVSAQVFTVQTFHDKEKKVIKEVYEVKDTVGRVPHGRYVSYFINGKIESRGQFTNNETSGVWEFFFETGKLKMRGILFKGANYGMWEYFFESGQKSMEGIINGREREGEWKTYYENGNVREFGSYEKNQREGHWKSYFEDGTLKGEIDYVDDKGRCIEYFQSGKVRAEGPKAGTRSVGFWRYFAEDGTLESDGEYTDGKKSGIWASYYPSGKPSAKGAYLNDRATGSWNYWYEDGKIRATGTFDGGKKTGTWVSNTPAGKLNSEVIYIDGRGEYKEYYESGQLKAKGLLQSEKREGTWEFYYETGQQEGKCVYTEGRGMYYGYFATGALQTKGIMDGDTKTGTWELYGSDGTLTGYYRPFYDNKKLGAEIAQLIKRPSPAVATHAQPPGYTTDRRSGKRRSGYFTPRYNEMHGVIFGSNPVWLAAGQLPLAIEFYLQERLGHEFEFIGIRNPFFVTDEEVAPGKKFERGYSIAIKQKLYNSLSVGMFYFGQEVRFTNLGHYVNEPVNNSLSPNNVFTFSAAEQRIEWGALVGYRLLRHKRSSGLSIDAFFSTDIGYRSFDVDDVNVARFAAVPQHSFCTTFHFGVNIGKVFSVR